MNTCPHCHIRVGGDTAYCPLCQNRLSGPAGEPYFPATAPRIHRASLLYKIVAFVLSALIVVAGAFDFLLMEDTPHRHFSILMAVWAVAVLRVVRAVLRRRFNGPRQIFNLLLLVSALLVFTDWFNGYTGYSLDLIVPILCCAALPKPSSGCRANPRHFGLNRCFTVLLRNIQSLFLDILRQLHYNRICIIDSDF